MWRLVRRKREESQKAARSALMALAQQATPEEHLNNEKPAEEKAAEHQLEAPVSSTEAASQIAESLNRVKTMDIEAIKQRFGSKLSEEQLEKLSRRLETMSSEELQSFVAKGKAEAASSDKKEDDATITEAASSDKKEDDA